MRAALILKLLDEAKKDPAKHVNIDGCVVNELKCRNPKCITTTEQELDQVFKVVDKENGICRCLYCESKEIKK